MKRKFTLLIAALALLTMIVQPGRAWGQTRDSYSYTFTSNAWTANGTATLNNVAWTLNMDGGTISSFSSTQGMHFGTNNSTCNSVSISTSGISGTITNVTVEASRGSSLIGTLSISVGEDNFYNGTSTTNALTTSNASYSYTGSASGDINILWTKTSGKGAYYIKSITVTYSTGGGSTPSISANDVQMGCNAQGTSIHYDIDNYVAGTMTATTEATWITSLEDNPDPLEPNMGSIEVATTVNESAAPRSATVTLTYTYDAKATVTKNVTVTQAGNPNASGGANNPYTVAQAIAAIDAGTGVTNVFATGIVSSVGYFSESNHYITYNISDNGLTTGNQLQAFHGKGLNGVDFTSQDDVQVGDVVIIYGDLTKYEDTYEFTAGNYLVSQIRPEKVATPTFSPEAGTYYEAKDVTIACTTEGASIFYKLAENDDWSAYTTAINVATTTTIWAKATKNGMNDSNIASATYTINTEPVITINPASYNATAAGETTSFNIDYINCGYNPEVHWFDANDIEQPLGIDWINTEFIGGYYVYQCTIAANTDEERVAKFEIRARDDNSNVYTSNRVTITQAKYVVDYATLPFEWAGGSSADFAALSGVTLSGNGSDYGSTNAPYLIKFDSDNDYIMVKTDSQPAKVNIGVKMIGGASTSTITVKASTDGETFDDGEELTISGKQNDVLDLETTRTFDADVRYVKMVFTKGSNVGVGPITIAEVDHTPSITINPGPYDLNSEGGNAILEVTYTNMPANPQASVIFYAQDGETPASYDWISATINDDYNVAGHIDANTGDARSAYFKVKGIDANSNPVYSALVTINQAAYALNIVFETTELNIEVGGEQDRVLSFEYEGLGENPTFEVRQYDATGQTQTTYEWLTTTITQVHKVNITVAANTGAARSGYFKVYGSDGTVNTESNLVTINQAEYVAPTYTVTYDANGGLGTMTDPNSPYVANTEVTLLENTFTAPEGMKWDAWLVQDANQTAIEVNDGKFIMPASNVTVTAQWVDDPYAPTYEWVLTALEDLTSNDVFVIVGTRDNTNYYGMSTDKGTSTQPEAVEVTIANNKLSASPADRIKWNLTGDNSTGYIFYPNGSSTTWLYCNTTAASSSNTNMRVGDGDRKLFIFDDNNYMVTNDDYTDRYVSLNGSTDWRGYVNTNQATTITFYKRQVASTDPQLSANDVNIASDETEGEITYTLENPVSGGILTAEITEGDWLTLGTVGATVPFTCSANTEATARTATVTLTYSYGENSITATAVVTQAALVIDFATLPFEFNGGRADIENTVGLTQEGLDSDYGSSPKLKFNSTDDWMILKLNEAPKSLSYDIKGNGFSDNSVFTVQTSADGVNYVDLATYTTLGEVQSITHVDLDADVRYIKWIYTNKKTGNVALGNIHATEHYDTYGDVTLNDLNLTASSESLIVHSGSVVTLTGTVTNDSPDNLVIEDGGQLIHTGDVAATLLKDYKATTWPNTKSVSGWYTIASPVDGANVSVVTTTANYDFYAYDEANYTWRNEKVPANGITTFEQGVGYLYATSADKQGSFAGTMKATNAEVEKDLSYECTLANMKGFNLMGNPFTRNLTSGDVKLGDSYLTNYFVVEGGSELVAREIATYPIKPGQGFMVQATAENQKLVFNPSTAKGRSTNNGHISIAVGNESFNDMAYINIANGNTLRKMTLNTDSPKVYVMNNNKDYAAARVENLSASMPVCFQTKNIGTYTITVKANELDVEYLHLIDNVLHEDIDLLLEPSYSFIASGHDNAARFTLVFKANANIDEIEANDIFAYQNGSDIIVNGNGELQVFDATGRMVMNTQVNGIQTVNIPATGMYIFRMVGDEVKTQKIVVR